MRAVLLVAFALGLCVAAQPRAYGDQNHNGNGTGNHNAFSIRSPTRNSGVQSISNANAGGVTSSRNALCRWHRHCHIHQAGYWLP